MQKAKFNNELYLCIVIVLICGLFIWNCWIVLNGGLIGLLPMAIQTILLILILTKNKFAKIAIKIWSLVFLVIGSGMKLIGRLLNDFLDNFIEFDLLLYLRVIIFITGGMYIFVYAKKTIEIVNEENKKSSR